MQTSRWQGHVTPRALALTVQDGLGTPTLLARADEVIE